MQERDRYSRGAASSTGSTSGRGQQPFIMTEDQHHSRAQRPRTLIQALSDIQQYYVMETRGRVIPAELFTLQGTLDYMAVGFRSGLHEGLVLLLVAPLFEFWLLPLLNTSDVVLKIGLHTMPFLQVIAYTVICAYMGKYYTGNITKRAINAVLSGRLMTIVIKALLIWLGFTFLHYWGKPEHSERVWQAIQHIPLLSTEAKIRAFNWFYKIYPSLKPTSWFLGGGLFLGGVIPYGAILVSDWARRWRIRRNRRLVGGGWKTPQPM